jgi:hypothetical protein
MVRRCASIKNLRIFDTLTPGSMARRLAAQKSLLKLAKDLARFLQGGCYAGPQKQHKMT